MALVGPRDQKSGGGRRVPPSVRMQATFQSKKLMGSTLATLSGHSGGLPPSSAVRKGSLVVVT